MYMPKAGDAVAVHGWSGGFLYAGEVLKSPMYNGLQLPDFKDEEAAEFYLATLIDQGDVILCLVDAPTTIGVNHARWVSLTRLKLLGR